MGADLMCQVLQTALMAIRGNAKRFDDACEITIQRHERMAGLAINSLAGGPFDSIACDKVFTCIYMFVLEFDMRALHARASAS